VAVPRRPWPSLAIPDNPAPSLTVASPPAIRHGLLPSPGVPCSDYACLTQLARHPVQGQPSYTLTALDGLEIVATSCPGRLAAPARVPLDHGLIEGRIHDLRKLVDHGYC